MTAQRRSGGTPAAGGRVSADGAAETGDGQASRSANGAQSIRIPVFMPWAWYLMPAEEKAEPGEPLPPLPPKPVEPRRPDLVAIDAVVKDYTIAAMAVGMVPLPLVDMAALAALQVKMAHALGRRYHRRLSQHRAEALVAAAAGGTVPVSGTVGLAALLSVPQTVTTSVGGSVLSLSAASGLASLVKLVPVFGTLAGGMSMTIFAGATTYGIGRLLVGHFESGGTLLSGDPTRIRRKFRKEFKAGQAYARRLWAWQKSYAARGSSRVRRTSI